MLILGLHDGKDAGVALIDGGNVLFAANEERYSRRKFHFGFPMMSMNKMFHYTGVKPRDIKTVTVGFEAMLEDSDYSYDYSDEPKFHQKVYSGLSRRLGYLMNSRAVAYGSLQVMKLLSKNKEKLEQDIRNFGIEAPIYYMNHHMSHAAAAYYFCEKEETIVISSDGGGDGISGGIYIGRNGVIEKHTMFSKLNSAGVFWEIITQICGFNPLRHGGKITGLAAYSDGQKAYEILSEIYGYCSRFGGMENYGNLAFRDAFHLVRKRLKHLQIAEISAGAQRLLDEVFVQTAKKAVEHFGIGHLAITGGTFANVRTNLMIRETSGVESIFVFPHMGDGGITLGSALLYHGQKETLPVQEITHIYWGDEWPESQIRSILESIPGILWSKLDEPADAIADALVEKRVVGLFRGRMEFGPRALGHRSIIAEPTDISMMDWLNQRLERTEFMPFAPIILEEEASKYFVDYDGMRYPAKFMTICMRCTPLCKEKAPGIVHIDGTARPQTVSADVEPFLHEMLSRYRDKTGLPLAINTSFNKHEEPIVGSPIDAITELQRGSVDVLFLDSYRVYVKGNASFSLS